MTAIYKRTMLLLLPVFTIILLALLTIGCGTVIKDPQEHQAIQTYAQSCGRMPDALRNAPTWGRWRELIERAHTQSEQLDPPDSLREFHQVRLQWFGNMLHLAGGQSDDAEYDRSVFTTDPSFPDQLIGYFQAWVDLPRDTRDILRNNVCFPETDISTDTNDLKSVQEYASACSRTIRKAPSNIYPRSSGIPSWRSVVQFADTITTGLDGLKPPSTLRRLHDATIDYWVDVLEHAENQVADERPDGAARVLMGTTRLQTQSLAQNRAYQRLAPDVQYILRLYECIL